MDLEEKKSVKKYFVLRKLMEKTVMARPSGMDLDTKHKSKNESISCGGSPLHITQSQKEKHMSK
jgi:hypothetical protein